MLDGDRTTTVNTEYIEAAIEEVWSLLATPDGMNRYLTDKVEVAGGKEQVQAGDALKIYIGDLVNHALCVRCKPPVVFQLADRFQPLLPDGSSWEYRLTTAFFLEKLGKMTKVTVKVEGYTEEEWMQWIRQSGEMGWRQSLFNLKCVLELGLDLRNEVFGYPRLGVSNYAASPQQIAGMGLNPDRIRGNYLIDVFPGSPAANAGLRSGDLVTCIGGKAVDSYQAFVQALALSARQNRPVTITFYRERQLMQTEAVLSYHADYTGLIDPTIVSLDEVASERRKQNGER
ncbi:PDZ domain-containing protein [Brevibacillus fulvus]|uniref:Uncharacterized protein YndB with AHSA1/START domain n=1 Tax=Brevibacillus fulvus TaxID=1125967 RepID=A0A938XXX6_9BACL|nr:PDZ domain-containing protein [Brevibacillus fulvus]MBM7589678.1 uncharacterized protein YndB with AHSA1/START domain [Brevibacillus fulvus]